jgi:hypothetical protein
MKDDNGAKTPASPPKMSADKLDKRAKALRDNLRKRKAAAKDKEKV